MTESRIKMPYWTSHNCDAGYHICESGKVVRTQSTMMLNFLECCNNQRNHTYPNPEGAGIPARKHDHFHNYMCNETSLLLQKSYGICGLFS